MPITSSMPMTRWPRPTTLSLAGRRPAKRTRARGQALVEVALVVPVMLLILLAAGDLARVFGMRVTIESAARAGALEASQHPTSFVAGQPCNAVTNRVMCAVLTESGGSSVGVTPADVTMTCSPSPCAEALGNQVRVTVVAHVQLLTPLLAPFTGGQAFDTAATASAQLVVRPSVAGASPTPSPLPVPTPTPTPAPTPTPTPGPSSSPTPTPDPTPTPTPTPFCFAPSVDFSISPSSGKKKKQTFVYTDLSTTQSGCPLTWSWNFGDGAGDSTSTLQNPTHVYQSQGTFTVTLVASNPGGSNTKTRTVTVTP